MKLRLVKATNEYKEQICDMLEEWYASGESIVPYAIRRIDYHDFDYYCENIECKDSVSGWGILDSTFFCIDVERDIAVGAVNIRHYLNESLLLNGGHIGDGVRPSERRKGIATKMISLALEECRKLGIFRVLMVCNQNNIGSAKSIINNGGVLENEVLVDGEMEQRYWIDLSKTGPMPDVIRHASLEELPACVQVIRDSFKTVADRYGITEENAPRFTAFATTEDRLRYQMLVEKRPMYVYLRGGKIVGYYSLAILPENGTEMNNLAVLPAYRHQGIGEHLLMDALKLSVFLGANKVKIGIINENTILGKWYESFGFVRTGEQKFDFFPFTCGYLERKI